MASLFVSPSALFASIPRAEKGPSRCACDQHGDIIIYFTKEAKIFEKYGLDVDPVAVAGSGIASKALISGSVLISPIATPTVMTAVLAGSDMVILAHACRASSNRSWCGRRLNATEDIKGKTIGVTTFRLAHRFSRQDISPDRKGSARTKISRFCRSVPTVTALWRCSRENPGATLSHPNYIFAQRAGFHVLWDFFRDVDYPWSEIATTRTQIKQDRDLVMRYMRAHIEGIAVSGRSLSSRRR